MTVHAARSTILQKLRTARAADTDKENTVPVYHWTRATSPVEQFRMLLTANHARVITASEKDITQHINTIITQSTQGKSRIAIASARVREQYPAIVSISDPLPAGNIEHWKSFLFNEVEVGITSAVCAIASTGTVVMRPGPDEPRSLSLVPPCHIVIVREETLYNDFGEVIQTQGWKNTMPTNMVLVSGPSKTADIQQTLAYGAHGPRELFVLLIHK